MRLDHAGIYVEDLAGSERFLGEALGLPLVRHSTPAARNQAAFYSAGNAAIEVVWFPDAAERRSRFGDSGGGVNFSHVALGVEDLGAALAALAGRGVRFTGPGPTTNASRTMRMSDPATTGGVTYQLIQWYPPAPDADMPTLSEPPRAPGIGITGLDHVAAVVADLDEAKRVLAERLGLPLSVEAEAPERGVRFAFFEFGNAGMEVIEFTDPGRRAMALAPGETGRLDHIALAVRDVDTAAEALRRHGVDFATAESERVQNVVIFSTRPETSMGVRFQLIQRL